MSHNDDNAARSARRHRPAILAILVALAAAALALLFLSPWKTHEDAVQPAGAVAEGPATSDAPVVSPEGAAPTPQNP
ncbi:hypothetical protein [Paracoccus luteus]|uniref:hypothetical protein n=1 Tax=Paracoccus luteus TaxID=2508543 RepID=UPI0010702974|nr:hypothetical protein [Paracoccus luteus]